MPLSRRHLLASAAAAGLLASRPALAFPDRPMRIISPFNPGGVNDILARGLAQPLTRMLRQPVVVENRAGAGGGIGAAAAARATPDGHTLFMGMVDVMAINQFTYPSLPYDPEKDFAPVSLVTVIPFAIVAGPSLPQVQDIPGLLALAKSRPGALSFASWGVGSTPHLAFERVCAAVGIQMLHVPFTGQAPAMQAVMASQVDVMAVPGGGAEAMARDGRTRILATLTPERLELLPGVPTLREHCVPLEIGLWQALYAPARTPGAVLGQLNAAVHEAMATPGFAEILRGQAAAPQPTTPEGLAELARQERPEWARIVRQLGVRIE